MQSQPIPFVKRLGELEAGQLFRFLRGGRYLYRVVTVGDKVEFKAASGPMVDLGLAASTRDFLRGSLKVLVTND